MVEDNVIKGASLSNWRTLYPTWTQSPPASALRLLVALSATRLAQQSETER